MTMCCVESQQENAIFASSAVRRFDFSFRHFSLAGFPPPVRVSASRPSGFIAGAARDSKASGILS